MSSKKKTIDMLLGALTPGEKAGQLMVLGLNGTLADPEVELMVDKYCISGLRTSPYLRKFVRYLPEGAPGLENVLRPPSFKEKLWEEQLPAPYLRASEYAALLNRLRQRALDRKHGIPLHTVIDYESGSGSNYVPAGILTLPAAMGFGHLGDLDLTRRAYAAVGKQLKAIGFDHVHGPVVDVNTNPRNPEVGTRSFSPDPKLVIDCARAALLGWKDAGIIATLKHYPGRGAGASDSHFGLTGIDMDKTEFYRQHISPYAVLCAEKIVPTVMPAHSIYPMLDPTEEIATVSKRIITGILREELGFDGVITTDSMTMGGLMAKYSVGEAVVRAIDAGVDLVLLKDDNCLRYEAHQALTEAIVSGRLSEERIAESLRRIWSLKWDYGLFKKGGIVRTQGLDERLFAPELHAVGNEAAERVIHVLRDRAGLLPLPRDRKILIVDRVQHTQIFANDSWNHPAMLWEFLRAQAPQTSYIDYQPKTVAAVAKVVEQVAPQADLIVVTGLFDRNNVENVSQFVAGLKRFGKPVVMISNNPYPAAVPEEIDTVVVNYSLMRSGMEAVSRFLFETKGAN